MNNLEHTMKTMFKNIQSMSQKQLNYQIRVTNDMEDMCNYNAERFESLNMKRSCKCAIDSECFTDGSPECLVTSQRSQIAPTPTMNNCHSQCSAPLSDTRSSIIEQQQALTGSCNEGSPNDIGTSSTCLSPIDDGTLKSVYYIYSDKIGRGLGHGLRQVLNCKLINMCTPGLTYDKIINKHFK
jgi:hypothetical protein